MSPYRVSGKNVADDAAARVRRECPDGGVAAVLFVFWLLSALRAVGGVLRHETFGTEGTLALLAVGLVPILFKDAAVWSLRRLGARSLRAAAALFRACRRMIGA